MYIGTSLGMVIIITTRFVMNLHLTLTPDPNSKELLSAACVWVELQLSCHYLEASCAGNCERMTTGWPALTLIFLWRVQHLPVGHQPNVFLTGSAGMIDAWRSLMVSASHCQAAPCSQRSLLKLILATPVLARFDSRCIFYFFLFFLLVGLMPGNMLILPR